MLPLLTLTFTDWISLYIVWSIFALIVAWFVWGFYSAAKDHLARRRARRDDTQPPPA